MRDPKTKIKEFTIGIGTAMIQEVETDTYLIEIVSKEGGKYRFNTKGNQIVSAKKGEEPAYFYNEGKTP